MQKYDEVIGSASQRQATATEVDQNVLRRLGLQPEMTFSGDRIRTEHSNLVTRFIESWRNEKCAPELLPYEQNLVSNLQQAIRSSNERMSERFITFHTNSFFFNLLLGLKQRKL